MFKNDEDGRPSLEAVATLTKMMRARHYHIHESLLNLFLRLRLLSEFSVQGSYDRVDRVEGDIKRGKKMKEKREFRTKKNRKLVKERKVIEKEMVEADAVVGYEERDRMQAEMLKLVFATYFRILKAKTPHLMGAVLEGLARYAHLINQDFFGDILEALKDLIGDAGNFADEDVDGETEDNEDETVRNATRESLLCVVTAFALLQGQYGGAAASTLHLDLNFFVTHLYRTIHSVSLDANVELSSKSLHLPESKLLLCTTAKQQSQRKDHGSTSHPLSIFCAATPDCSAVGSAYSPSCLYKAAHDCFPATPREILHGNAWLVGTNHKGSWTKGIDFMEFRRAQRGWCI